MLPYTDTDPSLSGEGIVGLTISGAITEDLCPPPCLVVLRPSRVQRATMPEAPVHEHRDLGRPKDNIGSATHLIQRSHIYRVAKPKTVDEGTQAHFRPGIATTHPPHATAGLIVGGRRSCVHWR
jgi:hypothetical protein